MNNIDVYHMMTWFSSSYPIGSFNYSHGLECAIENQLIDNTHQLEQWLKGVLLFGSGISDAILFKETYKYFIKDSQCTDLDHIINTANALKPTAELWAESSKQGDAALKALIKTYPAPQIIELHKHYQQRLKHPTLAVVFGCACAAYGIALESSLMAFLHAFISNLVNAAMKIIPLGQTDGQRVLAAMQEPVCRVQKRVMFLHINDIGTASPMVDWTSAHHETQYTRLFQS